MKLSRPKAKTVKRDMTLKGNVGEPETFVGMAHLAGGGPVFALCATCTSYAKPGASTAVCRRASTMRGAKTPPIPGHAKACKYYEETRR